MAPRVTVLMTVYNGMPYLPQAIESVLTQTVGDLEFLIIDDASTDDSVACIRRYPDPRIRLVCNERNLGQARSLNNGLALSRAPYVARLDQDDVCLPDRLECQVAFLQQRPDIAGVGSWAYYIDASGRKTDVVGMNIKDYGAFFGAVLTYASPLGHATLMLRRQVLAEVGGYDESFAPCEDYALWCSLAMRRHSVMTIPRPLVMMRLHGQQQSRTRATLQQQQARRTHDQLVAAVCRDGDAQAVSALLRMEESWWKTCPSPRQIRTALQVLENTLVAVRASLKLSPREDASLRHRVYWWLGRGAFLAMLQQRRQSLPMYRFALRGGIRILRYPALFLYPGVFLLSWRLAPAARQTLMTVASKVSRQQYVVRLVLSELRSRLYRPPARRSATQPGPMEALYISYDGMLEPLGESQVVSYLQRIAQTHRVTLLSYEKKGDLKNHQRLDEMARRLRVVGIRWIRLRYHRWPSLLATGFDVTLGILVGWIVCRRRRVHLVHARGYVPSIIALCLKRMCGTRFLFDMRGFWPEEKVDAGHWTRGSFVYRVSKRWERRFFEQADAIVSLTEAGVRAFPSLGYTIPQTTPIEVIPTCVDLSRFSPGPKDAQVMTQLHLCDRVVVGCVGTLSNWYLRMPTLRFMALLARRFERIRLLFVTREDHACLRADARMAGIPLEQMVLVRAEFRDMPVYLRCMDLGVFFIMPAFSKQASAATKLAEFLATGVPVVINDGVGDSGGIVREHHVGVVLPEVTEEACQVSVGQLKNLLHDPSLGVRCRQVAQRYFDLEAGVVDYLHLYHQLDGGGHSVFETTRRAGADTRQPPAALESVLPVDATL